MGRVMYSKEQRKAIETSGHNILVSASAGSGKTTVLIERILNKLKQGLNIDEMLIVTFTELAASELKLRLRKKLTKELSENSNIHLRNQLTKLPNAEISTFHSFCNRVIKRFFYLIDADAKYKISEDIESYLIAEEVLEELFINLFEDKDQNFLLLVRRFNTGMHDDNLKKLVLDLYYKLRTLPFKEEFIHQILKNYQFDDIKSWNLYHQFIDNIKSILNLAEDNFKNARDLASSIGHNYSEQYNDDIKIVYSLRKLVNEGDFDEVYSYLKVVTFPKFNSKGSKELDENIKMVIKEYRDQGKQQIMNDIKQNYVYKESSQIKFIKENKEIYIQLIHLVHLFEQKFSEAKKENNLVDFGDLEIMALKILSLNNNQNEASNYYKRTLKEILIDEFQDTNSMQETIIKAVSSGNNIFMVGDVKQSIYRFRSAEPEIFQSKYKDYQSKNSSGELINLNANYRSREEVINFINYLFIQLMDETIGEIDYDDAAQLVFGQKDYKKNNINESFISLHLLEKNLINENSEEKLEKAEIEAHYVAQKIKELIDNEALVHDGNTGLRKMTYKDICILSRTKSDQSIYHDIFKQYNIPFLTTELSGYFDSIEVLTVLSILQIIDNPLQDIPLIGALRSPIFNINEKELIELKTISNSNYYYEKISIYQKIGENRILSEKLSYFMEKLTKWRESIKNEALFELLYDIYHNTNYYDFVSGQIGGNQRKANLDLLYDRAKQYEHITKNSLFRFIHLINFLKDKNKDLQQARTVSDNEDLVRFLTIHKSKGLEFPVVFLTNLSKRYNTEDEKTTLLFDKELGIAFSYFDLTYRVKYESLYQGVIKDKLRYQMLAEEMRLLYVGLTRAKERLYLIGTIDDFTKEASKLMNVVNYDEILLPINDRKKTNYLSLIMLALTRYSRFKKILNSTEGAYLPLKEPNCGIYLVNELECYSQPLVKNQELGIDFKKYMKDFALRLNYEYPDKEITTHFARQTVADIKKAYQFSEYSFRHEQAYVKTPKFIDTLKANRTLRGTIYHIFLQHIKYSQTYDLGSLNELKNCLINKEIITEEQGTMLDLDKILTFLQTDLVVSMQNAKKIHQELPFTTLISSKQIYPDLKNEIDVLVQGVMDLFVLFEDEAYLIDYKTDYVNDSKEDIRRMKKQYQIQLNIYKEALKNIYPNKVIRAYLYLLEIDKFIEI